MRAGPWSRARLAIATAVLVWGVAPTALAEPVYPTVRPDVELAFPRDEGSHPEFKLEWWYVTGWIEEASASPGSAAEVQREVELNRRGFQVTFFRVRTGLGEDNPSRFAPRQVLFAHVAIADAEHGRLRHAQRSGRELFDLVFAREGSVDVRLDDWSLQAESDVRYRTVVRGEDFSFELALEATQPPMLQGERGFSRKGPDPRAASHYYSLPQLEVSGTVEVEGRAKRVRGQAWFDHEWSSDYVDDRAQGWDWMGINLHDGGALMAFQMRDAEGGERWAAASVRGGARSAARSGEVRGQPSPALRATSPAKPGEVGREEPSPALRATSPAKPGEVGREEPSPALRATSPAKPGEVKRQESPAKPGEVTAFVAYASAAASPE